MPRYIHEPNFHFIFHVLFHIILDFGLTGESPLYPLILFGSWTEGFSFVVVVRLLFGTCFSSSEHQEAFTYKSLSSRWLQGDKKTGGHPSNSLVRRACALNSGYVALNLNFGSFPKQRSFLSPT